MKRTHLTKFAAVFTALLLLSVSSALPVLAGSLVPCTAEAGGEPPFEILAVEGGMAGSGARTGTGAGTTVGEAVGNAAEDIGNAVEDILPGNEPAEDPAGNDPAANDPAGNDRNPSGSGDTSGSGNSSDNMTDNRNDNAGNGNREEGQAGGDENGIVGDGTDRDTTTPDNANTADGTDRNPAAAGENTAAQNDSGMNWASIIVAILIAVALVVVIVALLPRKRTD